MINGGLQLSNSDMDTPLTFYLEKFKGNIPSKLKAAYETSVDAPHLSAIPIVAEIEGKHKIIGTGFILNIARRFFFVTAAHIIDDGTKYAIGLGDSSDGLAKLFNFEPPIYHSLFDDNGTRDRDNDDFAFVEIRNELALKILRARRTIGKDDLYTDGPAPRAWRAMVGYAGRQKSWHGEVQPRSLIFTTREHAIEAAPLLQLVQEKHILLSKEGRMVNLATGTRVKRLTFEGMSGGPIWILPTLSQLFSGNFKPKLCGMCVGRDPGNHFINGTRIGVIWNTVVQIAVTK